MKKFREDDPEELTECDGCRYRGLPLKTYQRSKISGRGPMELCELCASTFIGNSLEYPEQYDDKDAMQLVGYCTNLIMEKLNDLENQIDLLRRGA